MSRVHPTDVDEHKMIKLKKELVQGNHNYFFAFSSRDYADFDTYNKLHEKTTSCPEFKAGMKQLLEGGKPVVFFMTYDIGRRKEIKGIYIRHIICCLANKIGDHIEVFMFDMRNLRQIDNHLRQFLENQIAEQIGFHDVRITNMACVERDSCVYLQRFKPKHDIGWCMAWAMFFLDSALLRPIWNGKYAYELSPEEQKKGFAEVYRVIDHELSESKSNDLIELWFQEVIKS